MYNCKWKPHAGEKLQAVMESDNVVGKYAVCILKNNEVIGHLPKETNGKFAKTIFTSFGQTSMAHVMYS